MPRVELLRGRVASAERGERRASCSSLKAAKRLESLDVALARGTYLDAWGAALFAGHLAADGGSLHRGVACRVDGARDPRRPERPIVLLDGLALLAVDGRAAAAPKLRQAVDAFRSDGASVERVAAVGCACVVRRGHALGLRQLGRGEHPSGRARARSSGALALLSIALNGQGMIATWSGDFEAAAALGAEDEALKQATGVHIAPYGSMLRAAYEGRTEERRQLIDATLADSVARGEGLGVALCRVGRARSSTTRSAATRTRWPPPNTSIDDAPGLYISTWTLVELIEAARPEREGRHGRRRVRAIRRATANAGDSDWALGLEAPVGGAPGRGARGRVAPSRGDRTPGSHAVASRPRPRPPAVRRVAATREPPRRCS